MDDVARNTSRLNTYHVDVLFHDSHLLSIIGDVYIAGTPTQLFVEFGKAIKAGLPKTAMVSAFANDYCGYVPLDCFIGDAGGYEAKLCPTSTLAKGTGDKVVEGILELQLQLEQN
jgi:hypothetical protein